jgi:ribosomal protein L32
MAVPFRRKSTTRIKKGRGPSNLKFTKRYTNIPLVKCDNNSCERIKVLHQVCASCNSYKEIKLNKKDNKKPTN